MNKKIIILSLLAAFTLAGCSDFLDRPQKTAMDDSNYWTNESNVRLFVNGGYPNYFNGYDRSWGTAYVPYRGANFNDDMTTAGKQTSFLAAVQPANSGHSLPLFPPITGIVRNLQSVYIGYTKAELLPGISGGSANGTPLLTVWPP